MARIGFSGFAINDPFSKGNLDGLMNAARESTIIRNGNYSAKCNSGAGNQAISCGPGTYFDVTGANATNTGYFRAYFYFNSLPGVTTAIWYPASQIGAGGGDCILKIDSTGHLIIKLAAGADSSPSAIALGIQTWYRIEMKITATVNAANTQLTVSIDEVLVDGTSVGLSGSVNIVAGTLTERFGGISGGTFTGNLGWLSAPGANTICYVSDYALNDKNGASQNSYPGPGMCVLLLPTATSAAAAKWLDNDGTQTNMWQGVANTPPAGIAAATSPSHAYIKHTGGAAGTTDAFDATMKTYLAAGIKQVDTVNVIQYYIVTGEESGTGTKLLAIAGVSNPVVAQSSSFDVFAASGAQGIYPSNWSLFRTQLAMQYSPSVTVGTAPVYRVVRPETATRVASVCFMGMYVDYTPAASLLKPMRAAVLGA